MNNKKGFTIIEVLVSISLLAIIIVCFSPLFLNSFRNIQVAGKLTDDTYNSKTDMEKLLAQIGRAHV